MVVGKDLTDNIVVPAFLVFNQHWPIVFTDAHGINAQVIDAVLFFKETDTIEQSAQIIGRNVSQFGLVIDAGENADGLNGLASRYVEKFLHQRGAN